MVFGVVASHHALGLFLDTPQLHVVFVFFGFESPSSCSLPPRHPSSSSVYIFGVWEDVGEVERWLWLESDAFKACCPRPPFSLIGCHSAIAPPRGGGEASLKEQNEPGLEQGESSGHEGGPRRWAAPAGGDWAKASRGAPPTGPLTSPIAGGDAVAMEIEHVAMGRRVGRLRKSEGRIEAGSPPGPPLRIM